MSATNIEWTDATWNPARGCSLVSAGCTNCYAMRQAHRFSGPGKPYEGLARLAPNGPVWTGDVRLVPELLDQPLRWRKPRRVFVNSMSDLFHESLPFYVIDRVFAVMALAKSHTFQVLTKRAERMRHYFLPIGGTSRADHVFSAMGRQLNVNRLPYPTWPLPNVHLGTSCEDHPTANERIVWLLQTPAAMRFVSLEPLLGPVNLSQWTLAELGRRAIGAHPGLSWVIVGGESGHRARPCEVDWIRSVVRQCREAGVPVFVKQLGSFAVDRNDAGFEGGDGEWPEGTESKSLTPEGFQGDPVRIRLRDRKGGDPSEWPEDLRIREFPAPPAGR